MGHGLPLKVHPDEPLVADRAIEAASHGMFKPGFYHWPSFLINLLFFEYIIVYFMGNLFGAFSTTADLARAYFTDPTFYFWLGRITTTLFCIGGMSCIYLIGKKLAGRSAGLAAAVLMGFDALFVEHSRLITPDVPSAALMIYVWYCLIDYIESGNVRILYSAAFVGGVAMSTKYNAGLMLIPIFIAAASRVQHWPSGDVAPVGRRLGKYLLLCLLFFAIGFLIFTPYSVLDAGEFWRQLRNQFSHQGIGHIGMEASGSALMDAAAYFYSPYGLALLVLTLAGIPMIRRAKQYGLILLIFPVLYLITLAGWVVWAERYMLFLLPTCFIYAGVAIGRISQAIGFVALRKRSEIIAVIFALLLVLPSLVQAVRYASLISRTDTRVTATRWVEENIRAFSTLLIEKGGPEPYKVENEGAYLNGTSPLYYYRELEPWYSIESRNEEPLVQLRAVKPEYIISSGYTHDRYFRKGIQQTEQELVRPWIEYYTFIETNCVEIKAFDPGHEYPGNWVKIYRVPDGLLD
jgi:hypothetical protein